MPLILVAYILSLSFAWSPLPFSMQWSDVIFLGLLGGFVAAGGMRRVQLSGLDYVVVAYVAGSLCSLVWAEKEGPIAIHIAKLVYLALVYLVIGTLCMDESLRRQAAWGIALGAALLSLVGTVYVLAYGMFDIPAAPLALEHSVPYLGQVLRLDLHFYTPELLGCFLTVGIAFALALRTAPLPGFSSKWLTLAVLLILVTEAFTFSHSVVGFAFAAMVAYCPRSLGSRWIWIRRGFVAMSILLFAGMLFVSTFYVQALSVDSRKVPHPSGPVDSHVLQTEEWPHLTINATYSYLHYHVLKVLAWETFIAHPFSGIGLGNFPSVSEKAHQEGRVSQSCRSCEPHNTVLGQLAETGLLGGLPLLALWAWLFRDGWRLFRLSQGTESEWIARACFGGLVGLFVNGLYTDVMNFRFLWVSMAVLRGLALSSQWTSAPRAQEATAQDTSYAGAQASTIF